MILSCLLISSTVNLPQGIIRACFDLQGHWTRIAEQVAGGLKYKPPRHDINAPDLYLPLMAFATYIMLCGFTLGQAGKYVPLFMFPLLYVKHGGFWI